VRYRQPASEEITRHVIGEHAIMPGLADIQAFLRRGPGDATTASRIRLITIAAEKCTRLTRTSPFAMNKAAARLNGKRDQTPPRRPPASQNATSTAGGR
jgi:hypothetical protein